MLWDKIKADTTTAMRSGDVMVLQTLRMLQSELNYKVIDLQRELTDVDVEAVVVKESKKRREAIQAYKVAGRDEQVKLEQQELQILSGYLPVQLNEQEVMDLVKSILAEKNVKKFSEAMKLVAPELKGKADGAMVAKVVRDLIEV